MGNILARFKKKKDTEEVLGLLEDEIIYIEKITSNTSPINYYKIIFHSVVLYGLVSILYYLKIISDKLFQNKYIMAVLLTYPLIAHYYYKFDVWYYNRKIVAYNKKLTELRREKKKILDEIMENETFKKAKEILEKYAPQQLQSMTSQNFINQRILSSTNNKPQLALPGRQTNREPNMGPPPATMSSAIKPRLALSRPLIPRDRTIFDRLADTVLGDGLQNQYALICRTCGSHNGMARKEEFDYLAFRCAYCSQWNPSLKPRPPLAIIYDNKAIKQNGSVTIEEITDQPSLKFGDSNTNENVNSEQKGSINNPDSQNSDTLSPTFEEMEDVQPSDDLNSKHGNLEKPIDNSEVLH